MPLNARVRPLRPGYSISRNVMAPPFEKGTLGGFVSAWQPRVGGGGWDHAIYILSNCHVMSATPFAPGNASRIMQPAVSDTGVAPADEIATLTHYTSLNALGGNPLDAALARLDAGVAVNPTYQDGTTIQGIRAPVMGEVLTMDSAISGPHTARVVNIGVNSAISVFGALVNFNGYTEVTNDAPVGPSIVGDSGGIWRGADGCAVLLNFAGNWSDDQGRTVAVPLAVPVQQTDFWGTPMFAQDGSPVLRTHTWRHIDNSGFGIPMPTVMTWVRLQLGQGAKFLDAAAIAQ